MTTKEHYEAAIGTLEYWNNCGSEWNYSTINDKIFKIALCVKFKGVLYRVVNKYAKGREYADRRAIQWCILRYLSTQNSPCILMPQAKILQSQPINGS